MSDQHQERRAELGRQLDVVRCDVAEAAAAAGRDAEDITLVVVTKTWPLSDLELLYELGIRDMGENRHQEAEQKAADLRHLDIRWHFIGQIQSKKAGRIAAYADVVHSVGSVRVAQRLNSGAHNHDRHVDCLIQVSLDPEDLAAGRGGVRPAEVDEVAHAVETAGGLRLRGVMGVAPLGEDPGPAYGQLADVARRLAAIYPDATWISAGMSGDYREAILHGATHVRVGSAVLGQRPPLG